MFDAIRDELVFQASFDWLYLAEVHSYVRLMTGEQDEVEHTLAGIRSLLERGLWQAGDLERTGFVAWPLGVDDAMARIASEWASLDRAVNLGDVAWFANTDLGMRRATELRANGYQSVRQDDL